jgi:hypothetical protein
MLLKTLCNKLFLAAASLCLAVTASLAQTGDEIKLAAEQIACGQYFAFQALCMKQTAKTPSDDLLATRYSTASTKITTLGLKNSGLSEVESLSYRRNVATSMATDINKDCKRIGVLQDRFATSCKLLYERPADRLRVLQQEPQSRSKIE